MSANPIEQVGGLTTTDNVPKADVIAWVKARVAQVLADATEVNNTVLAGQLLIMLKSNGRVYYLDTSDTTTADNGTTCLISADGKRFKLLTIDGLDGTDGLDGANGSIIFVQNTAPSTSQPAGSIWIDADSTDLDLYTLSSGAWIDTGRNLKGTDGVLAGSTGSNDNRLIRSDGTGGATVQASAITVDDSGNMSGVGTLATSGDISAAIDDAANNDITRALSIQHGTSGSPAAGIGVGANFKIESAGGVKSAAALDVVATDVTNGSEDFDFVFKLMAAGATAAEVLRVASTGIVTLLGNAAKIVLHAAGGQTLTGGFRGTSYNNGTVSSGTLTPDANNSNIQHYTNDGAHTLAPPANTCSIVLDQTNGASAGAVTRSGFTKTTGDTLTTTNGHKFRHFITVGNAGSHCHSQAMQ